MSWDCEITQFTASGGRHRLVLGVTDDPGGICRFISEALSVMFPWQSFP